jgi:hypothetical protein
MCKAIAPVASITARTRIGWPSWTKLVASSRRGNVIGACCMARTNAGALLVCDCYTDNDAVNPARATLMLSLERIVVSALGAYVGAIEATYFGQSLVAFGVAIFLLVLMSLASRLDKPGYQYAGVTLAIVVLIPRAEPAWLIAVHRFIEVSLGILVALALAAVWREQEPTTTS